MKTENIVGLIGIWMTVDPPDQLHTPVFSISSDRFYVSGAICDHTRNFRDTIYIKV